MFPNNNPHAVQRDFIANAGGPRTANLVRNVGGGVASEAGGGYIALETASGPGFVALEGLVGLIGLETPAAPGWVLALRAPSGDLPLIASDFKNGRYWAYGALTTADALWVEDTDWGTYDPAYIIPGLGLSSGTQYNGPVLTSTFSDQLSATGFTGVLVCNAANPLGGGSEAGMGTANLPDYPWGVDLDIAVVPGLYYPRVSAYPPGVRGIFAMGGTKMAGTVPVSSLVVAGSVAGQAVLTSTADVPLWPATFALSVAGIDLSNPNYIESVVLYAPQPSADLTTLSV